MSAPAVEVSGEEHGLFRRFVETCRPILAAGFEHAAKVDPERHAAIMAAVDQERARPRLVVEWDKLYCTIDVEVAGKGADGEELKLHVFTYRLQRETPPGAH
jgi:hypothetical protein